MKLSEHFTLDELTHTDTGLPNDPEDSIVETNLEKLATLRLEPTRKAWGAIKVNCGYRSDPVNKKVGGVPTSQHRTGDAADIYPLEAPINVVYDWMVKNLVFGQCILETGAFGEQWIHISNPREKDNQEALVAVSVDGKMRYRLYEV